MPAISIFEHKFGGHGGPPSKKGGNMSEDAIRLLRDLIAIDSVNPSLVPGGSGESNIADAIATELRGIGLSVEMEEAAPGRPNVIGVLEGRSPGRALMLCGHMDTVGVEGMKAPFDPVEKNGRIYGRGSQDMKGGVAAMISAARKIANTGGLAQGRLILAAVADEEYASIGAEQVTRKWKADAAVVLEPTDLIIALGHKGFAWVEITTHGIAAHGSRPKDGRDAVLRMGRVLAQLEARDRNLQSQQPHPLLGTGSLHASLIHGGRELSTYPDRCTLHFERRLITGESLETALHEAESILQDLRNSDPEFRAEARHLFGQPPYEIARDHPLPDAVQSALARVGKETTRGGMTFWTDAAILGKAGIPSVVFGPGGAGLHGLEEYVRAEEVLLCRDALVELVRAYC